MRPVRSIGNEAKKRGVYDFRDWRHGYGGRRNCTIALAKRHCRTRTRSQSEKRKKSASHHLGHRRSGEARDITCGVRTKTLFLISSISEDTVALQHNAIEATREAGVTHIVKLSAFGASNHSKAPICVWHYQIEQEMQKSGMEWTILRPHHFMQNLLTQTDYIINDGVVYSDSGDGKIPYIDARDIAAVAAVTLTKPGHYGKKYVITGSEALSYRQATEIISNTIDKPLRFVDESPDAARARREREGYPPAIIESFIAIGAYQRAGGKTVTITNVVSDLTGRRPRTFSEFARDHAALFRG